MRYTHFSKSERLELSILLKKGYSLREIGRALKRNPSSVSREIKENSVKGIYDPHKANHKAYVKRKYSKYQGMKVQEHPELRRYIEEKLLLHWSPDVIAGCWNKKHHLLTITAKGIYKFLYSVYGQRLCTFLKYKRYSSKRLKGKKTKKILIPNKVLIDQRPRVINDRRRFGDFEADTMGVPKYTHTTIIAAVERKSRFILAKKIPRLKYAMDALGQLLAPLPVKSLTLDNGVENVRYEKLDIPTYLCHPYSSWEKGAIENVFGLIRWYIPKKASLVSYSDEDISAMVEAINNIPRKSLNYQTPKEVFEEHFLKHKCCASG